MKSTPRVYGGINNGSTRLRLVGSLLLAVAVVFLFLLGAGPAQAYYNTVREAAAYKSIQDKLSEIGMSYPSEAIPASVIPNGVYDVDAYANSTMFKFYHPETKAADSCQIEVRDNDIVVRFQSSPAYTAIYFGTAEEAASLTDASGMDGSAYNLCDPPPTGDPAVDKATDHYYEFHVDALDGEFTLSAFNGASSGIAQGGWYERDCMILSSEQIRNLIYRDDDSPQDEGGGDGSGGDGGDDGATPSGTNGSGGDNQGGNGPVDGGSGGNAPTISGAGGSAQGAGGGTGTGVGSGNEAGQSVLKPGSKRGVALSIAGLDDVAYNENAGGGVVQVVNKSDATIDPVKLGLLVGFIALVLGGALLSVVGYRRALGKPGDLL